MCVEEIIEASILFDFYSTNNQTEYEAFIVKAHISVKDGVEKVRLHIDSQLIISQVKRETCAKHHLLYNYVVVMKDKLSSLKAYEITYVLKEHYNIREDVISKLASTTMANINYSFNALRH